MDSSAEIPATVGRYSLVRQIGEGATSLVYEARFEQLSVALKIMRSDVPGDLTTAMRRFRKEGETLSKMNHPSLLRVLEFGEHQGLPYIALELLEGEELSKLLRGAALTESQIVRIAKGIAGALGEVHRHGFIHRDVKPENIFIDRIEVPRLIDFGFAEGNANLKLVRDEAVGTFIYASPEQSGILNAQVDATSDLYSLGAVLFECATQRPPFQAVETSELLRQHLSEVPANIHQLNSGIRPTLALIVEKLLQKQPKDRYQTAEGLISDLNRLDELDLEFKSRQKVSLGLQDFRIGRQNELPLFGREHEMETLANETAKLKGNSGASFLIEGEPGSGKSYLIKNWAHSLEPGTLVLSGIGRNESNATLRVKKSSAVGSFKNSMHDSFVA